MIAAVPFRFVPGELANDAQLPMLDVITTARSGDVCTGRDGDRFGRMCLCNWSPWFEGNGEPGPFRNPDYEPQRTDRPAPFSWLGPAEGAR